MNHRRNAECFIITCIGLLMSMNTLCLARPTGNGVRVLFMEPDSATVRCEMPVYRLVTDTNRINAYRGWIDNEPAQWAIKLYGEASRIVEARRKMIEEVPAYHIALIQGGNEAAIGFCLRDNSGMIQSYPHVPYIKLAPEDWVFTTTFLHETGHVVLYLLNDGKEIPKSDLISIPHSTAALTDRGTAFDKGFAIHLETLASRFSNNSVVRERYHHDRYLFGIASIQSEYHRQVADLLTYSQSRARYHDVAENDFAFCSAFKGPDYLRVQLEKSRDYSCLRSADQLLQSEGFYASFFYSFLLRGSVVPTLDTVNPREDRMLRALAFMFGSYQISPQSPFLLWFTESYRKLYPQEAPDIIEALLELSHGVFVDQQASAIWRDHYLGALRLDMSERYNKSILDSLSRWRADALEDPRVLYSCLGPQIRCAVPEDSVKLVAFGDASVLSFDVNTVEEGVIRMIPQISDRQVRSWLKEREKLPYADVVDFKNRSGLSKTVLEHLMF